MWALFSDWSLAEHKREVQRAQSARAKKKDDAQIELRNSSISDSKRADLTKIIESPEEIPGEFARDSWYLAAHKRNMLDSEWRAAKVRDMSTNDLVNCTQQELVIEATRLKMLNADLAEMIRKTKSDVSEELTDQEKMHREIRCADNLKIEIEGRELDLLTLKSDYRSCLSRINKMQEDMAKK